MSSWAGGPSSALPMHGRCYRAASSRTLSVAYAWALLSIGELEEVERRLGDGERWLTATDGVPDERGAGRPEMVVVDRREFSLLAALIAVYRAVLAQIRGDVATTVSDRKSVV